MAQTLQVTCISRSNRGERHEHISYIGGSAWRFTESQAIKFIEGGMFQFFVNAGGRPVKLVVSVQRGHKHLTTDADAASPDSLINLPECQFSASM